MIGERSIWMSISVGRRIVRRGDYLENGEVPGVGWMMWKRADQR